MAFQAGTAVNPSLGQPDFSGFGRAAEIQGAAIANLGAQIGGAIFARREKKREKELNKQAKEMVFGMLKNNPEQAAFLGLGEDFTLDDVTPFVDVVGAKPSIALITQLNMASMKDTAKRPTIGDINKLREFLPSDKIIEDGRIVDTTLRNEIVPKDDPLVQQLLQTDVGQSLLYGYKDSEFLGTTDDDGTPADDEDTAVIDVEPEPTGSRVMELGGKAMDAYDFLREAGTTMQSLPLATLNFLTSGDRPTFSESLDVVRPKMQTLKDLGIGFPISAVGNPLNVTEIFDPRRLQRLNEQRKNLFE
jgi:hypothetical protein